MGSIATYKFEWEKKMLQENTTAKRRHAENVISESSPRTEKSWRLIVPVNVQELINLGPKVGCSYTAKCTHEHLTVACVSQTTSKKVATAVCKDRKTVYACGKNRPFEGLPPKNFAETTRVPV